MAVLCDLIHIMVFYWGIWTGDNMAEFMHFCTAWWRIFGYGILYLATSNLLNEHNFWALSQNFEMRLLTSTYLSVRPSEWKNSTPDGRSVEKILLKSDKNGLGVTWRPIYIFWSRFAQFFLEWKTFQTKVVKKIKTHFLCSLFLKIMPFMRYSGPLTYELNSFPRAGRNSSWS
jgi:hypothetical protein